MSRLEEELQRAIAEGAFPGASLLVGRGGEIVYQKVLGNASVVPEAESLEPLTLFDIASLTKPLATATLCLLAQHEGRLNLDHAVGKRIPALDSEEKKRITPRHLLKHTSGLPAWRPYFEEIAKERPQLFGQRACAEIFLNKIAEERLEVPVAYQKIYSDLGFILLGILLEKVYEKNLDTLFDEKVVHPLGLRQTFYLPSDRPRPDSRRFAATEDSPRRGRMVRGEVHDDNAFALGGVAGHAGLFSHGEDLHKFLVEMEKGYRGESSLLNRDSVQDFVGPKVKIKLGWDVPSTESQAGRYFSPNTFGHLGYTGCSWWSDLNQGFHVILLTNRVHPSSQNEKIKTWRPILHDLVYEELIRK